MQDIATMRPTGFIYLLLTLMSTAHSATVLKGEQGGKEFDLSGNPYIIDSTITVSKNTRLVFKEGCVVLVNPFCGIEVAGNFVVKGTEKKPVIFTTINDNKFNPQSEVYPQPLDWNGLTFQLTSDTVFMQNFRITYSVFGIKSWNNRITIHNGLFGNNGQYDLVINDELKPVEADVPYTFNYTPPSADTLTLAAKMALYEERAAKRKTLTTLFFFSGIVTGGLDGYLWYKYADLRDYAATYRGPQTELNNIKDDKSAFYKSAIIAASCSGTFLVSSALLFLIPVGGAPALDNKNEAAIQLQLSPWHTGVTFNLPIRTGIF